MNSLVIEAPVARHIPFAREIVPLSGFPPLRISKLIDFFFALRIGSTQTIGAPGLFFRTQDPTSGTGFFQVGSGDGTVRAQM